MIFLNILLISIHVLLHHLHTFMAHGALIFRKPQIPQYLCHHLPPTRILSYIPFFLPSLMYSLYGKHVENARTYCLQISYEFLKQIRSHDLNYIIQIMASRTFIQLFCTFYLLKCRYCVNLITFLVTKLHCVTFAA